MSFYVPSPQEITQAFPEVTQCEQIGTGGFKAVYKVLIGQQFEALKLAYLERRRTDDEARQVAEQSVARIQRELAVLGQCKCRSLVTLASISPRPVTFQQQDYIAYSEEYLDGGTLRSLISQEVRPSANELRDLMVSLARAIKELWQQPNKIVHRDIKPENVIKLNDLSRPYVLLDLGIAFSVTDTPLTPPMMLPGTPRYMAPEMLNPDYRNDLDFRSDLYSAAVTAYEYASGQHPLAKRQEDVYTTFSRILRQKPAPLELVRNDLPTGLTGLIDSLMRKKPALRPSNLDGIIMTLENMK